MTRRAWSLLPLLAFLPLAAEGADLPHRKPGLWAMTTQPAGMPHPMTSKLCLDAATEAAFNRYAEGDGGMNCSKRDIANSGNQTIIDSVCTFNGSTATSHGVLTWTGDTAYHMDSKSHWDPPMMGKADRESIQDATWMGPCPAGMSPGDMTMPNGMTMNINRLGQPPRAPNAAAPAPAAQ